eukprot:6487430-Amphidinium_carterae.1
MARDSTAGTGMELFHVLEVAIAQVLSLAQIHGARRHVAKRTVQAAFEGIKLLTTRAGPNAAPTLAHWTAALVA